MSSPHYEDRFLKLLAYVIIPVGISLAGYALVKLVFWLAY